MAFLKNKFINNMRRGFATNSSSSHSLVYYRAPQGSSRPKGKPIQKQVYDDFGWGDFVLKNVEEKLIYALVNAVGENAYWNSDEDFEKEHGSEFERAYSKYKDIFPEFNKEQFKQAFGSYVDHQSRLGEEGIKELAELARDPKAVIYGGNDNEYGDTDLYTILANSKNDVQWGKGMYDGSKKEYPENK